MKTILAILLAVMAATSAQNRNVDPRNAAILAEARYLSGDGSFGAAYVQEDGTDFKEETDSDGTRKGSYSYVDPDGKKITVNYTAGKNGFQVTGDHLPKAPAPLPVPAQQAPVPRYNSAPQYNSVQQSSNQDYNQYNDYDRYQQPQQQQYNSQPQQQQYNPQPQQQYNNFQQQQQQYTPTTSTTPYPTRYFPAGKINLNRNPDGYQYSFSSQ